MTDRLDALMTRSYTDSSMGEQACYFKTDEAQKLPEFPGPIYDTAVSAIGFCIVATGLFVIIGGSVAVTIAGLAGWL